MSRLGESMLVISNLYSVSQLAMQTRKKTNHQSKYRPAGQAQQQVRLWKRCCCTEKFRMPSNFPQSWPSDQNQQLGKKMGVGHRCEPKPRDHRWRWKAVPFSTNLYSRGRRRKSLFRKTPGKPPFCPWPCKTKRCSDESLNFCPGLFHCCVFLNLFFLRLGKRDVSGLRKCEWSKAQRDL